MNITKDIVLAYTEKRSMKVPDFQVKLRRSGTQNVAEIWHKENRLVWAEPNSRGNWETYYSVVNGDSVDVLNEIAKLQGYGTPFNPVKVVGSVETPPKYMVMYKAKLQYPTEKYRLKDLGVSYREMMFEDQSYYVGGRAKWVS